MDQSNKASNAKIQELEAQLAILKRAQGGYAVSIPAGGPDESEDEELKKDKSTPSRRR
jgi:hypothetical protein